ncbi:DUF2268 domain-containing protein [Maricaulaceae bacterium NA33B04]|nr:DUF2268 domain-containing protein [Maricaulaceae bacterium NA33B04]
MKTLAAVAVMTLASWSAPDAPLIVDEVFEASDSGAFSAAEQARVDTLLDESAAFIARDFPEFADTITVALVPIARPGVDALGGVTGRAQAPGALVLEVSSTYPGGMGEAIEAGLLRTALHEMHHLVRGWTIENNRYGPGIAIAAANEGLAELYSEDIAGSSHAYPPLDDETFTAWAQEILALPGNANYGEWMFAHPDGRKAIGYRTGAELVRRAMANSGLDIIEMSELSPEEIWTLAGFRWPE